jgi:hypothetical protein
MTTTDIPASLPRPASRSFAQPAEVRVPWFLVIYLAAITIIGKGPTYLGIPPLYWGEFVLALGLWKLAPWIRGTGYLSRTRDVAVLILLFMTLGAVLTVPSLPRWGLDALRDAAMWYYGAFFFIGLALTSRPPVADRVWRILRIVWIFAMVWNTADIVSRHRLSHLGPIIPWRGVPILFNGTHEGGQNLALGALIVLCTTALCHRPVVRSILGGLSLLGLAVFAMSEGRGMRVGIAAGVLVVLAAGFGRGRRSHFNERLLILTLAAIPVIVLAGLVFSSRLEKIAHLDRFAQADPSDPQGTANWRVVWWKNLYDHVMATNPVFGIGFGESLHIYNPFLEGIEDELVVRSPHNFNITVFTRMGILGLCLWAGILIVGIGALWMRVWSGVTARGQPYTDERRDELAFWIVMLVCTVVNSSFGVLMEGPVLGIWFWFALGFASGRSLTSGVSLDPVRRHLARLILRRRLVEYFTPAAENI